MLLFWVLTLIAPALWAFGFLVDRYVLFKGIMDFISYDIFTIWLTIAFAALVILTVGVSLAFDAFFVGTIIGIVYAFLFILYDLGIMRKEATEVSSIIYINPLFVALLSWIFLRERLTIGSYGGIALLTLSAFIISYKRISRKDIALVYVFIFAVGVAIARVIGKSVLADVDVWSYLFWVTVGNNIGAVALTLLPLRERHLRQSIKSLTTRTLSLIVLGSFLAFLGYVFFYSALATGSVTLASGVTALLPSMVLGYSSLVLILRQGSVSSEPMSAGSLIRRGTAVALIAIGTWAIVVG